MRQNDIGLAGADGVKASINSFADVLDLRPHVAPADDLALAVDRRLAADDNFPLAAACRDDDRLRVLAAGRSNGYRLSQIFGGFPDLLGALNIFGGFLAPYRRPIRIMLPI